MKNNQLANVYLMVHEWTIIIKVAMHLSHRLHILAINMAINTIIVVINLQRHQRIPHDR